MDSVNSRIFTKMDGLTPNEAKVAQFCLENPEVIIEASIHDVARRTDVSVASVSRLANSLGYRNWKEMRVDIAKGIGASQNRPELGNPIYPEIAHSDVDETVIDKVFNANSLSILNTLRQLDKEKLKTVARKVSRATAVMFFGLGGSGFIARDEALRFSHLKLSAHSSSDAYLMMLEAAKMKKGQIAFGLSNSGRTRATVAVLEEAHKCGVTTVGIANFSNTPLEAASDYFFTTSFPSGGGISAALTARGALQTIMDAIYVLAAQYGSISERVDYMNSVLETQLRIPSGKKRK